MNTLMTNISVADALDSLQIKWTVGLDEVITNCSSVYFNASYSPNTASASKYSIPFTCTLNEDLDQLEFTINS